MMECIFSKDLIISSENQLIVDKIELFILMRRYTMRLDSSHIMHLSRSFDLSREL